MKNYKEITFDVGSTLKDYIIELIKSKGLVKGSFNGHILYSDTVSLDSAYLLTRVKPIVNL